MTHLTSERLIRAQIERLNPGGFVVWLHESCYRVVYVEQGYLVLFDHRTAPPDMWRCDWRVGRRSHVAAHQLAIDDVLDKLRQLQEKRAA